MNEQTRLLVNGRYQITLPAAAQKTLGIKTGDRLLMDIQDGMIILAPQPQDYVEHMAGLHQGIWRDVDTAVYLAAERA